MEKIRKFLKLSSLLSLSLLVICMSSCKEDPVEPIPSVSISEATSISTNSASVTGTISTETSITITERGICYNTSTNPTTANSKIASGTGTGNFTLSITGLNPHTTYYVRAYAISGSNTTYSDEVSFTTQQVINEGPK